MYKFQIKSKNMIVGKTQSVYFPDINDDMDMLWISSTKLTDLNKSININSTTQSINKFIAKSDNWYNRIDTVLTNI
jgi:hypothetical protein